jgi:hypothetical protein
MHVKPPSATIVWPSFTCSNEIQPLIVISCGDGARQSRRIAPGGGAERQAARP